MEKAKVIDYRFKILYALGMVMVVCGHARGGGISIASDWFPYGGLHLAMFVFSSGYFYMQESEQHVSKYILKKFRNLIVPLYIYNLLYGIIVQLLERKGFAIGGDFTVENLLIMPLTNGHQFGLNMGGWFVVPLFMVEVYNILLRKICALLKLNISESVLFVINIIVGVAGNYLACIGYQSGWWLVLIRMLYFIPFYSLGIFYKSVLYKYDRCIPGLWYFGFILAVKLIIVCVYGKMPSYTPSWCNDFTEGPLLPIITGYLGIAFWFRIVNVVEPVIGRNKVINLIADNSYSIMMNQFAGFMLLKTFYALINRYTSFFQDFDWTSYKTDIFWYYKPFGEGETLILYVIFGIGFSILLQTSINWILKNATSFYKGLGTKHKKRGIINK